MASGLCIQHYREVSLPHGTEPVSPHLMLAVEQLSVKLNSLPIVALFLAKKLA
jgi:hypothetical protein